jgi:hypothetical protein
MDRPWFKFLQGTCSEDFYFLVNAKELGFDLWVNPKPVLGHLADPVFVTKDDFHRKLDTKEVSVDEVVNKNIGGEKNEDVK